MHTEKYLNTSHVNVQPKIVELDITHENNLNTSHVNVQQML